MNTTESKLYYILISCSIFIGLYLYNPLHLYFLGDDFLHIPESIHNVWMQQNSIRPVGNFSLHLDYWLYKTNAVGYHFTNLLLHFVNSILVGIISFQLFKKFKIPSNKGLHYIVAVFFFIYPFHSETIFWIIGRSASMGALFFLASLFYFFKKENKIVYAALSILFYQIALLSYESSWLFPLTITLIYFFDKRNNFSSNKKNIYFTALAWLLLVVNIVVRIVFTGNVFNHYDTQAFASFDFKLLALNFLRLLFRTWLPPFYNIAYFKMAVFVVVFVVAVVLFVLYKKKKLNIFFVLLTLLWLVSYLPYLALGIDTHGTEGERFLYMPSVFFCFWLMYVLSNIFSTKYFLYVSLLLIVLQLYFLKQTRTYYVKAGKITHQTVQQINLLSNKERIFIEHLPQYNKGAVVFRRGLNEALQWLYPHQQSKLIIVSIDDSDVKPRKNHVHFFEILYSNKNFPKQVNSVLVWNGINYEQKDTTGIIFNPNKDAWLNFNDTTLTIIR